MTACSFKAYDLRIPIHSHHTINRLKPINKHWYPKIKHQPLNKISALFNQAFIQATKQTITINWNLKAELEIKNRNINIKCTKERIIIELFKMQENKDHVNHPVNDPLYFLSRVVPCPVSSQCLCFFLFIILFINLILIPVKGWH